ncbi:MAG: PLDc N-terminal domain-containing protein [Sphingobacteriales bacterium]|nr:PLDc N-terminal domain-containing protein [Sphingobacteriales bacterium]
MMLLYAPFSGMEGSVLLISLIILLIWSIALVAIANGVFKDNTTKICWFFIVLVLNLLGVLLFVFWGRKEVLYEPGKKKSDR